MASDKILVSGILTPNPLAAIAGWFAEAGVPAECLVFGQGHQQAYNMAIVDPPAVVFALGVDAPAVWVPTKNQRFQILMRKIHCVPNSLIPVVIAYHPSEVHSGGDLTKLELFKQNIVLCRQAAWSMGVGQRISFLVVTDRTGRRLTIGEDAAGKSGNYDLMNLYDAKQLGRVDLVG